jgi:ketosteroid isomerase-like protein
MKTPGIAARHLLMTLLLVTLTGTARPAAPGDARARAAVAAALERFTTAFNDLDWPTFSDCLDDNVTSFNPALDQPDGFHRRAGRAAVEAKFRAVFAETRASASGPPYLHIVPRDLLIQIEGRTAVVTFEFARPAGSTGRRTLVFVQRAHGWKIIHIHASNTAGRESPP